MKQLTFLLLLAAFGSKASAQNAPLDHLANNEWVYAMHFSEASLKNEKRILLMKLGTPKDSLKAATTRLVFKSGQLRVIKYDPRTKQDTVLYTGKYELNNKKSRLVLTLADSTILTFDVAFMSSGSLASLTRKE